MRQNQEAFRQFIHEAYNQGNYEVLPQHVNPDFVEHQFGLKPIIAGMHSGIAYLRQAFPDFSLTIEEMVADGDRVWARMTARGTNLGGFMGPPNGRSFEVSVFDEARFANGKIVEHWGSPDRFALLPKPKGG